MTVKVVSPGIDTYAATCPECDCRFTYQRSDVRRNFMWHADEVACPHCGRAVRHKGQRDAKRCAR